MQEVPQALGGGQGDHLAQLPLELGDRGALQLGVVFEFRSLGAHRMGVVAVEHQVDEFGEPGFGRRQRTAPLLQLAFDLAFVGADGAREFGAHLADEVVAAGGVAHVVEQPVPDRGLGEAAPVRAAVAALGAGAAVVAAAAGDHHRLVAQGAVQKAGQRVLALGARALGEGRRDVGAAGLGLMPQPVLDDAKRGLLPAPPLALGPVHVGALARVLVAVPLAPVEDDLPDVQLVLHHLADGQVAPLLAAGTRDAVRVELLSDGALCVPADVHLEDASHHGGLVFVHDEALAVGALAGGLGPVAVRPAACRHAGVEEPVHAALGALLQLVEVALRHRRLHRTEQLRVPLPRVDAVVDGDEPRAPGAELLQHPVVVADAAPDARQVFGEDHVDQAVA